MSNNTDKISILLKVTLEKANVKVSKVIPMLDAWPRPASENERKEVTKAVVLAAKELPKTISELASLIIEYKGK